MRDPDPAGKLPSNSHTRNGVFALGLALLAVLILAGFCATNVGIRPCRDWGSLRVRIFWRDSGAIVGQVSMLGRLSCDFSHARNVLLGSTLSKRLRNRQYGLQYVFLLDCKCSFDLATCLRSDTIR